ncbi:hypothetical protein [uncultured Winogradskyella sp.]|uniref:hypothetical protein n=1 Tax=uncultured Winogradskyella sp. TaxID=395353 RepID=UPI0026158118|nr:hypothetical protein [uncultured Winogradskyella sp.]
MKLLKSFLLIIILVSFSACSSDDDGGGSNSVELTIENLVGTYEVTFLRGSSETSVTATDGSTVVTETEEREGDTFTNAIFVFNANGTYTTSGNFRETSTVTITGQSPETESEIVSIDDSGTYSVNTESRTIIFDSDEINDVTRFNGTELRIVENYIDSFESFNEVGIVEIRMTKLQ